MSVYAQGSFVTERFRPEYSDVDLVAVVDALPPAEELALLKRLRAVYQRRQAVLPSTWARSVPTSFARRRLALVRAARPPAEDRRAALAGRARASCGGGLGAGPQPALRLRTRGGLGDPGWQLQRSPCRARVGGPAPREACLPTERRSSTRTWRIQRASHDERRIAERVAETVSARSATLIWMPFERESVLLLEAGRLEDADRLLEAALAARTLRVSVTTSRLAEDSWRRGFRWIAVALGDHLPATARASATRSGRARRRALLDHRASPPLERFAGLRSGCAGGCGGRSTCSSSHWWGGSAAARPW